MAEDVKHVICPRLPSVREEAHSMLTKVMDANAILFSSYQTFASRMLRGLVMDLTTSCLRTTSNNSVSYSNHLNHAKNVDRTCALHFMPSGKTISTMCQRPVWPDCLQTEPRNLFPSHITG